MDDGPSISIRVETLSRCLTTAGSALGGLNLDRLLTMSWSLFLKSSDTLKGLYRYCSIGATTLTAGADDDKGTDSLASDDELERMIASKRNIDTDVQQFCYSL